MNFKDDYSIGAHPEVLKQIIIANDTLESSYQQDSYSHKASQLLKNKIQNDAAFIRFVSGGTLANLLVIDAALYPYEAVIAVESGHINLHEAGAVEYTGHKIIPVKGNQGKIMPIEIIKVLEMHHTHPHMLRPKMVYLSNSTELGTIYTKKELEEISEVCRDNNLFLFLDGARLGAALSSPINDLTLADIYNLTDVFYIGGTKNGGLMGEAIIIKNPVISNNFDFHLKQKGALPAKTRFFGAQFIGLFQNNLYFDLAMKANNSAMQIKDILKKKKVKFKYPTETNQVFPIFSNSLINELEKEIDFYKWEEVDDTHSVIRLVTSWKTKQSEIDSFNSLINKFL